MYKPTHVHAMDPPGPAIHRNAGSSGTGSDWRRWHWYRQARRGARVVTAAVILLIAAIAAHRRIEANTLRAQAQTQPLHFVSLVTPKREAIDSEVRLPGSMLGAVESPIYARGSGYLVRWSHDIGSSVQKGDVLALVDAPEVRQQLAEATAARDQAQAALTLARNSRQRWEQMREDDFAPQQALDERESTEAQARAALASSQANVRRLQQLVDYQRVVAPFAGVVTRRNAEVGQLVGATGAVDGKPLFVLTQIDPLRILINVPQAYASLVHIGMHVGVSLPERAGKPIDGQVTRTAQALDPASRTLQTEVMVRNDGSLFAGAYVQVVLSGRALQSTTLPSSVLLFRKQGAAVAAVDAHDRVHIRDVKILRDLGSKVEIRGVDEHDHVVLNPSDSLGEGETVAVVSATPP